VTFSTVGMVTVVINGGYLEGSYHLRRRESRAAEETYGYIFERY
jgi:hypothetical protein